MSLAITEDLHEDESLISAAVRHAGLNDYPSASWVADLCGKRFPRLLTEHDALVRLAECLGFEEPTETLRRGHLPSAQPKKLNFWGHGLSSNFLNMKTVRLCLTCIREQPYLKSIWSLDMCRVCHIHGCSLVDAWPGCQTPIGYDRADFEICRCDKCEIAPRQPVKIYPAARKFWSHVHRLVHGTPSCDGVVALPREFDTLTLTELLSSLALFQALHVKGRDLDTLESALQKLSAIDDAGFHETQETGAQLILDWPVGIRSRLIQDLRRPRYEARILEHARTELAPLLSWQLDPELEFVEREIYDGIEARWQSMLQSFLGDAYTAGDERKYLPVGDAEALLDMKPAELRSCFDTYALTPGKMAGTTWRRLYVIDRPTVLSAMVDFVCHEDSQADCLVEHVSFTRACLAGSALKIDARPLLGALLRGEISYHFTPGLRKCIGTMRISYASFIACVLSIKPAAENEWISFNAAVALSLIRPTALEDIVSKYSIRMRGEKGYPDNREVHVGSLLEFKRSRRQVMRIPQPDMTEQ